MINSEGFMFEFGVCFLVPEIQILPHCSEERLDWQQKKEVLTPVSTPGLVEGNRRLDGCFRRKKTSDYEIVAMKMVSAVIVKRCYII